jgi:hypothetical protein
LEDRLLEICQKALVSPGQLDLPRLAEDVQVVRVTPQSFQQGEWVHHWPTLLVLPVEQCERERSGKESEQVE